MARILAAFVAVVLGLASLGACDRRRLTEMSETSDARIVRSYAQELLRAGHANIAIERCSMFAGSRNAYCLLEASPPELAKLRGALGLRKVAAQPIFKPSCLDFAGFGRSVGTPPLQHREVEARVERWEPGDVELPPNQDNVKLVRLYEAPPGSACVELTFPYG